jgi:ketosteroid isomerase-like protein
MNQHNERRSFFMSILPMPAFMAGFFLSLKRSVAGSVGVGVSQAHVETEEGQRLAALEKRLQAMEDLEAVKQLHYRYKNAFMQADWETVLDCFSQDAVLDIKPDGTNVGKGFAEVRRQFGNMAKVHVGAETDYVYHPRITVTGDTAKGTWMVTDNMHIADQPVLSVYGIYTVAYKKIAGEWKISLLQHRHRTITPSEAMGPPED